MVLPDLQRTTAKGKWWLGRKLMLRIHLGAFLPSGFIILPTDRWTGPSRTMLPTNSSAGAVLSIPGARPTIPRLKSFAHAYRDAATSRQSGRRVGHGARLCGPLEDGCGFNHPKANIAYPSDAQLMVKMTCWSTRCGPT